MPAMPRSFGLSKRRNRREKPLVFTARRKSQSRIRGNDEPRHRHRIESGNARFGENVEKPAAEETDQSGEIKFCPFKCQRNRADCQNRRHEKRMRKSAMWKMSFDQSGKRKEDFADDRLRRINVGQKRHPASQKQDERIESAERQTRYRNAEQKMILRRQNLFSQSLRAFRQTKHKKANQRRDDRQHSAENIKIRVADAAPDEADRRQTNQRAD